MPAEMSEQTFLTSARANGSNGSTLVGELAPRPGFSPQARMPPTTHCASRGEGRGLLVLTAGPVPCFYRRHATGTVASSNARGFSPSSFACGPNRGMRRGEDSDENGTGFGVA